MFVAQVDFCDGISQPESVFIRRLYARIGTSESSHLILDGVKKLNYELVVCRGLGNKFRCSAIAIDEEKLPHYSWEKEYDGFAEIKMGSVSIVIISVSSSLAQRFTNDEPINLIDELREKGEKSNKIFPALLSISEPQVAISLDSIKDFFIGKSRNCIFRADIFPLKKEYALIRVKDKNKFEINSLSPEEKFKINGVLFNRPKVLEPKDRLSFASGLDLIYLNSQNDLFDLAEELPEVFISSGTKSKRNIRSISGPIKPELLPIVVGQTITIGRDAAHNIWIDAPFVSRLHCSIYIEKDGYLITDFSTNGILINEEKLEKGEPKFFPLEALTISFGHGASIYISELNDSDFKNLQLSGLSHVNVTKLEKIEEDVLTETQKINNIVEVAEEISHESLENEEEEVKFTSFEDYQKRSLRLSEDSGSHFMNQAGLTYDDMDSQEYPTRIGYNRFIPQIFIGLLILIILGFLIILGLNMVR